LGELQELKQQVNRFAPSYLWLAKFTVRPVDGTVPYGFYP